MNDARASRIDPSRWRGRPVLVTGHTGFKGSWLATWLLSLGAEVHGLALDPPTEPSLFTSARIGARLASDRRLDVRDAAATRGAIERSAPSVVLHLAAQPLVRDGYRDPAGTLATNVLGTAHVLDACRRTPSVEAVVVVTTDKVYVPGDAPHREDDPLGAEDPYAWSKVMAEQVVETFRTLPAIDDAPPWSLPVATARAGNVVGGGDWSSERLVPDCIRAFQAGTPVDLRYPAAIRPWQHVLDPLHGYLLLAERLLGSDGQRHATAYNFGPTDEQAATVDHVARALAKGWGGTAQVEYDDVSVQPHENPMLRLHSGRAASELGWQPRWDLETTLERTVAWYRAWTDGADPAELTATQIAEFTDGA